MLISFLTEQNRHLGIVRSDMLPREGDEVCIETVVIQSSEGGRGWDQEYYTVKRIVWRVTEEPYPENARLTAVVIVAEIENS